jgi:hypothetical protein
MNNEQVLLSLVTDLQRANLVLRTELFRTQQELAEARNEPLPEVDVEGELPDA